MKLLDRILPIGPRSVLFGAHCFFIHPFFVAWAWTKLYGFPFDPRLWIAFVIHDLGYLFMWCKNMDGPEGNRHVEFGAQIMGIFGPQWHSLCLYHSRFYAKKHGAPVSRLCVADKLATALTPSWLYLPLARRSGELSEYMALSVARTAAGEPKYSCMKNSLDSEERWYADVQEYMTRWVAAHKDGQADTWTPEVGQ